MNRQIIFVSFIVNLLLIANLYSQDAHREAAKMGGNVDRGRVVFESKEAACSVCHRFEHVANQATRLAGPNLHSIGDKFSRDQLITEVLQPNSRIHPDFGTVNVVTVDGLTLEGVLQERTDGELVMLDAKSQVVRVDSHEYI